MRIEDYTETMLEVNEAYLAVCSSRECLNAVEGDPEHFAHKAQVALKRLLDRLESEVKPEVAPILDRAFFAGMNPLDSFPAVR